MSRQRTHTLTSFRFLLLGMSTSVAILGANEKAFSFSLTKAPSASTPSHLIAQSSDIPYQPAELIFETEDALMLSGPTENNRLYKVVSFQGQAGQEIVITIQTDDAYRDYIPFTPAVIGPSGNPIQGIDNIDLYRNDIFSGLRLTLPQSGTYQLRVQSNVSFLQTRQITALPFQVSIWSGIEGYKLLEQADSLSQQLFSLIEEPEIPDFSTLSESELEALYALSESELEELFSPSISFSEPDPEVIAQLSQSVSSAFQLFEVSGDKAGQLFILQRYPEYTTASEGDDDFRAAQIEIIGQIAAAVNDPNFDGTFTPSGVDLPDYADVVEAQEEQIDLARGLGSTALESSILRDISRNYIGRGQYQAALESLQAYQKNELEKAATPADKTVLKTRILPEIAWVYYLLGDYQTSNETYREYYQAQATLTREQISGRKSTDVEALYTADEAENRMLDTILNDEVDFASLAESSSNNLQFFLKSAASLANPTDYLPLVAYNYYSMGDYDAVFQLTEAIEQQTEKYRPLTDELSVSALFAGGGSSNLIVRAFALGAVGRHTDALNLSLQVLEKDNSSFDSSSGPNVLLVLGQSYYALGNLTKAYETYQKMLVNAIQVGDRWSEAYAYSRLAEILTDQKQPELAIAFYKKSVNTRESIRSSNTDLSPELRLSFVETIAADYRALADLLLKQDRVFEAQEVLDLLRVQELEDYLRTVRENDPVDGILDYWDSEQNILASYTRDLGQSTPIPLNDFVTNSAVQSNIQTLKRTASTQVLNPRSLEDLRDNLSTLDNAALLYPLVLEDRLEVILVTPDALVRKTVAVSEQTLSREISQFRRDLTNVASDPTISGGQLYQRLIEPLAAELAAEGIETLLYAADSQLRYVPLGALHTGNQWLAQKYSINQITAASLTDFSAPDSNKLSVIAGAFSEGNYSFDIGDSRFSFSGLPYAGKEVEAIDKEVDTSDTYFNQQFSPNNILPQMANYGVVHFATHAAFLPGSPNNSFILFGNGDRVNLRDVASWNLPNVDLIVLSACQTAVSEDFGSGDEILGFGYQMQQTGARAAIASLWQVDDGGTQVLMNAFYLALENGFSKAEALQRAQQALINNDLAFVGSTGETRAGIDISGSNTQRSGELKGDSAHPYYWAPFILIGNGL